MRSELMRQFKTRDYLHLHPCLYL